MISFYKKIIFYSFVFHSFPCLPQDNSDQNQECFKAFLDENFNEEKIQEHLSQIKKTGQPKHLTKSLLKEFYKNKDPAFHGRLLRTLGENNPKGRNRQKIIRQMLETLHNKKTHYLERKGAAQGLGYLLKPTEEQKIKILTKALKDSSGSVRRQTAWALGKIKPEKKQEIEQQLIDIAKDLNEEIFVREAALNTLEEMKSTRHKKTKRQLIEMAKNPNEKISIRKISLKILGEIIHPEDHKAVWRIYELLTDTNSEIKKASTLALRTIDPKIYSVNQSLDIQELYQHHNDEEHKEHYNAPKPFGSWFAVRVFLAIHRKGYFVIPEVEFMADKTVSRVSGQKPYRIDLVVMDENGKKLAIECDGRQHEYEDNKQDDLNRQKKLESYNWEFWRIPQRDFYSQPDQTLEKLWGKLEEMGIKPLSPEKKHFFQKIFFWR